MPRKVVNVFRKNKRKSHPHSKNATDGQNGFKKKYRGQGRWKKLLKHLVKQVQREAGELVFVMIKKRIKSNAVKVISLIKVLAVFENTNSNY